MLPPLPIVDGNLFVDNSGWIETNCTCHRMGEYKNFYKRIGTGEKAALNFGTAFHMAMEYRYKTYANQPVDDLYYEHVAKMFTEFFELHPVPAEDWRTLNLAMDIVRRYNKRFANEAFNLLTDDTGKPLVELPFAVPLIFINIKTGEARPFLGNYEKNSPDEILIIYCGKIDLPINREGRICILDFKTASQLGQSYFDGKRLSSQPRGYAWAFEQTTQIKVSGYVIRAIRTKEVPKYVQEGKERTYKGEKLTPDKWWNDSMQEEYYDLKDGELEDWKQNTITLIEEILWHYRRGYMPMRTGNEHACVNYGRCQYYEVCRTHKDDRLRLLASGMFTDNTWSPLRDNAK